MNTIILDIDHSLTNSQIQTICDKYSITPKLIQETGPGGGNPQYLFSSPQKSNIIKFLTNEYGNPSYYSQFIN